MSEERIQMVIKPARMMKGKKQTVNQCGSIDGAMKIQIGIPLSHVPKTMTKNGKVEGYLVVEFELNGAFLSDVPIKTGGQDDDNYDKALKKRGNLFESEIDIEIRSNTQHEHE